MLGCPPRRCRWPRRDSFPFWLTSSSRRCLVRGRALPMSSPATYSLLVVCCSVFSERKAFTLESQKQGALNPHMEQLLTLARENELAAMRVVALFLPVREVFDLISDEDAVTIYHVSMAWLGELAGFIEEQWSKGVVKCSRRLMRVPPRGAGVNSSGYNAVQTHGRTCEGSSRWLLSVQEFRGLRSSLRFCSSSLMTSSVGGTHRSTRTRMSIGTSPPQVFFLGMPCSTRRPLILVGSDYPHGGVSDSQGVDGLLGWHCKASLRRG